MEKKCFVVQGFGEKTDFATGRKLNLDASYEVIKEAVEEAGLKCIRADEVIHSGTIDKPMYELLLDADLVIADLSTSNANALYELGVRHAVRPFTTIVVAESEFKMPFDINHLLIRPYKHMGEDIGRKEATRLKDELKKAIGAIMAKPSTDSPLYTFFPDLQEPKRPSSNERQQSATQESSPGVSNERQQPATEESFPGVSNEGQKSAAEESSTGSSMGELRTQFQSAKKASDWDKAIEYLQEMLKIKPDDVYVTQQLALATYKRKKGGVAALLEAKEILTRLNPGSSHDAETLGLWGAVHKRLWEGNPSNMDYLNTSIEAYKRGFINSSDYYNGINYAFLLNARASTLDDPLYASADWVEAEKVRKEVIKICETRQKELRSQGFENEQMYWVLATLWEAYFGLGDTTNAEKWKTQASVYAEDGPRMLLESTNEQIEKLRNLLADSPLKHFKGS